MRTAIRCSQRLIKDLARQGIYYWIFNHPIGRFDFTFEGLFLEVKKLPKMNCSMDMYMMQIKQMNNSDVGCQVLESEHA